MRLNKVKLFLHKLDDSFSLKHGLLSLIRRDYGNTMDKVRNYKIISKFFEMNKKGEYTLDDETWHDLDMNNVYEKLDRTYSSLGEEVLYYMLRNPIMKEEELIRRDELIQKFKNKDKLREKLQCIFFNVSKNQLNTFLDMVENDLIINKVKYYLYSLKGYT
jgi:DNA mismatch repair ATPase MutS